MRGAVAGVLAASAMGVVVFSTPPTLVRVDELRATNLEGIEFAVFRCSSKPPVVSLSLPITVVLVIALVGAAVVTARRMAPSARRWTIVALGVAVLGSLGLRLLLRAELRDNLAACERRIDEAAPASSVPCACSAGDPLCSCL